MVSLIGSLSGCHKTTKNFLTVFGTDLKTSTGKSAFQLVAADTDLTDFTAFMKDRDRYEDTLSWLQKNPAVGYNGTTVKVEKVLRQSRFIVLNYSYRDVLRSAKYSDGCFSYETKDFEIDLANLDYHLNAIMAELTELTADTVLACCALFDIYADNLSGSYVSRFNETISGKCREYKFRYLDVSQIRPLNGSLDEAEVQQAAATIKRGLS